MQHLSMAYMLGVLLVTLLTDSLKAQQISQVEADSLLAELQNSKPDTNRVKIWIRLGEYQVYKPGEFPIDMDSARIYAQQALTLSQQLGYHVGEGKCLNVLGTISRESKAYDQAIIYQRAAINLFRKHSNLNGEAQSYLLLAQAMRDKGDGQEARQEIQKAIAIYSSKTLAQQGEAYLELANTYAAWGEEGNDKIKSYQRALQLFTQAGNKAKQADVYTYLGDVHGVLGDYPQSLIELRKSLALYRSINYTRLQGVYDLLGTVLSSMGDYQEGLRYGLLAIETAEVLKESSLQLCTIYNRVGLTYYHLKQFRKAEIYFKKSLVIAQKYDDRSSIVNLAANLFTVLHKLNQPEEGLRVLLQTSKKYPPLNSTDSTFLTSRFLAHYTKVKQYAIAQKHCNQLLVKTDKLQNNDYAHIVQFFLASQQHGHTRKYLAKYQQICKAAGDLRGTSLSHLWWFQMDSMQASYLSAIKHYQLHKQLEDSLFNETKSRQIANLEVLNETEKRDKDLQLKEQSIQTLNKEKQLQGKQIQQDELIRNAIIGGAVMLLLLLAVTYHGYRLKQRGNLQLQAQQGEINQKNGHLSNLLSEQKHLLNEKEWLLKEIHHRVKNNLQIVMSLLNSQSAYIDNEPALTAIHDSQHRVHAMSLIHQKLYYTENVSSIDMSAYIRELGSYLADSFNTEHRIRFEFDIAPLVLDVSQAVPVGLILNEAITNSLKYAFPDDRKAVIAISLSHIDPDHCLLSISDNGIGIPVHFKNKKPGSLGMSLIEGLSEDLGGNFSIENNNGTIIKISFEHDRSVNRPVLTNQA
jgi:two-component system, sensor histidine kinase PdtaS